MIENTQTKDKSFLLNQIIQGDCLELLRTFSDKSVHCIVTDPPYFLPATHYNTRTQFTRNFADLGILESFFRNVFKEFARVIKPNGTMYIFCDGQSYPLFYYHLYPYCKSVRPLIWNKTVSINGFSWRHQHELIIFAEMPLAEPKPSGNGDILTCSAVPVGEREHPAEKPIKLLAQLIAKSTNKGDIVLDPFAGSGSTCAAAEFLERQFIGIELSSEYIEIAKKRFKHKHQGLLKSSQSNNLEEVNL